MPHTSKNLTPKIRKQKNKIVMRLKPNRTSVSRESRRFQRKIGQKALSRSSASKRQIARAMGAVSLKPNRAVVPVSPKASCY